MNKHLVSVTCCAVLIGNVNADDHWYGSATGGASLLNDMRTHGVNYNGQDLSDARLREDLAAGYFVGASFGRSIAEHWRVEAEFLYNQNDLDHLAIRTDGGLGAALGGGSTAGSRLPGKGDTEAKTLLANAFYDFQFQQFRPYLGAGLGIAHITINDSRAINLRSLQATAPVDDASIADSSDTVFAYQVGAGIGYPIRPGLTASVDYRFLSGLDPEFRIAGTASTYHTNYHTNNVGMSLRFDF